MKTCSANSIFFNELKHFLRLQKMAQLEIFSFEIYLKQNQLAKTLCLSDLLAYHGISLSL